MKHLASIILVLSFYSSFAGSTHANPIISHASQQELKHNMVRYDSLGNYFFQKANYKKALLFYKQSFAVKKMLNDIHGIQANYEEISNTLQAMQRYKEAIPYELKAIDISRSIAPSPLESYYQKVKQLLPKANDSLNLTRLYYKFGLLLSHRGEQKRATGYFKEALRLAYGLKNDKAIATISNELAGNYWDLGEKELSTKNYKVSLEAAKRLHDSNRMAGAYLNLGDNYKDLGDYKTGMEYLLKALNLKEHIRDSSRLSFYYLKAAEISKATRNWDKWEKYIRRAYDVMNKKGCATPMGKALIYENLGGLAEFKNKPGQALPYYDTLMQISKKIGYVNGEKVALTNKAELYKNAGQFQKALQLTLAADKFPTQNPFYIISSNNQKAELYQQLKQYRKALRLVEENISSAALANYAPEKRRTFQLLYELNAQLKNYKEALQWDDSLRNFENYLRDKDVRTKIAELETKYQTEKKEQKIQLLSAQNETSRQRIRTALLLIAALIVIILFGVFVERTNKLQAQYRESMLRQQLLRTQMNPHFIFNALTSIQNFMLKNDTKMAAFYLGKFASISRLVLEYSTKNHIPLDKEIELLESYIELEKMQSGNLFTYEIRIEDEVETDFIQIPPMAIQPFVENAIKYGLKESTKKGGHLLLIFKESEDLLEVVIEDNGPGILATQNKNQTEHHSMAMEIFEKRRKLLEKRFKKHLTLTILDLQTEGKSGTRVTIHLPIL